VKDTSRVTGDPRRTPMTDPRDDYMFLILLELSGVQVGLDHI
jgi:hypothetical protein